MFLKETEELICKQFACFADQFQTAGKEIAERLAAEPAEVALLLRYLYANMPFSDVADYSYEMFREFAVHGVRLRKERLWKGEVEIPDTVFLDSVVFHRVNTEGISACRTLFYENLKKRVSEKRMEEAILETNRWCAEEATYQSTDERTISAEAVFRNGIGRCGEESVFTVNALRSIGIPARQVYAHRWAHCDDNHAWVEAWCEGKWHFLGACEPEMILDLGWFVNASSRAMMINSRLFGSQKADRDVIDQRDISAAVNQLSRYAQTTSLTLLVTEEDGTPVQNAQVRFELLNYAELVAISVKSTDAEGRVGLETGKGSLFVSVWKGDRQATAVIDTRKDSGRSLVLSKAKQTKEQWISFDMFAPADAPVNTKKLTEAQKKEGIERLCAINRKRLEKIKCFPAAEAGEEIAKGKGNHVEIRRFLETKTGHDDLKIVLLDQLREKDFRDCQAETLLEHLEEGAVWNQAVSPEIFARYILNPRISGEQQSAYRKIIRTYFDEEQKRIFRKAPRTIWEWICENIQEKPSSEYEELLTTPAGVLRYRQAAKKSKKVLFVAVCRSLGIPARLHPRDGEIQYYKDDRFVDVRPRETTGIIRLKADDDTRWVYMQNWTIAQKEADGYFWKTLQLGEGCQGEVKLRAEAGTYRVITTNRLPNGNQFAAYQEFAISPGEIKDIVLQLRKAELKDMLEKLPLEEFGLEDEQGRTVFGSQIVKAGPALFIWADVSKEPTEHIFNELCERAAEFAVFGDRVNLILHHQEERTDPAFARTRALLPEARVYIDRRADNITALSRRMYGDPDKLPLILVVDQDMHGIYAACGYNVGTGDMLLRILRSVSD
ncbi:MAG: transglutaminase domain-containing protein [Lachnospiraceae bacterium]|nr:transglutaminase domain-containing protein [Lachnospiraceae bacterium]MDY5741389.1 transglutaminase domain-containing protein [Lachnospiraceae bacterium]